MKYKIYRQFKERIAYHETLENLGDQLFNMGVENTLNSFRLKGRFKNLEVKIQVRGTLFGVFGSAESEIKGKIKVARPYDDESLEKASEILTFLAQYEPKYSRRINE